MKDGWFSTSLSGDPLIFVRGRDGEKYTFGIGGVDHNYFQKKKKLLKKKSKIISMETRLNGKFIISFFFFTQFK